MANIKKDDDQRLAHYLNPRVSLAELTRWKKAAKKAGVSFSSWVRRGLDQVCKSGLQQSDVNQPVRCRAIGISAKKKSRSLDAGRE